MERVISPAAASSPGKSAVQVLLVDDHAMFREGLARTLEAEPGIEVVGQCSTAEEAQQYVGKATLMLLDVDLGRERALDVINSVRQAGFNGQFLIVTAGISGVEAVQLVQAGVTGIMHKHHSGQELCDAIRRVVDGEAVLEPQYLPSLFRTLDQTRVRTRKKLTDRDRVVLRYIFEGMTNRDIGRELKISEGAVKASVRQLCEKLSVRTRSQLVRVALEEYKDQL